MAASISKDPTTLDASILKFRDFGLEISVGFDFEISFRVHHYIWRINGEPSAPGQEGWLRGSEEIAQRPYSAQTGWWFKIHNF